MKILFIQTGGTIDKNYPKKIKGYAFEIDEPAVKNILGRIEPSFNFEIISLFKKDSLDLTTEDRKQIKQKCIETDTDKIIITHGTDTMLKTAKSLEYVKNKTIVLTGALKPEKFINSDAVFNIGFAIGSIQCLPYGIYIAMNGCVFFWKDCIRDITSGKFIKI
jgi:L-asparaginase